MTQIDVIQSLLPLNSLLLLFILILSSIAANHQIACQIWDIGGQVIE